MLKLQLRRMRESDQELAQLEAEIDKRLQPYHAQRQLLKEVPGVDWAMAAVIIAELGGGHEGVLDRRAVGLLGGSVSGQ